ncbi:hypothetical protein OPV22_002476 [Ensete ventricosum]|uniref:Uncharacterized protein n=1 Tax=Ensete ventricosum TaxID=4639 RepID=A0AAV8RXZ2_ENSVE|nr:hypothetical protein OPV22_002476 [Ensete ventricosum]
MGLSYSREGAARRFVRSPPLAARSGGPKRPVLACFWAVFACCGGRGERSSGRGIRVAGKVLPFASFAVRRSPLARAAKNGQFWPVFGPFFACRKVSPVASFSLRRSPLARAAQNGQFWPVFGPFSCAAVGRGERSSGRGSRVAGKVLPSASFAVRRSPLALAASAASGAKRQPSQHPGTPRVAQGWMGLSCSREGAARRFVRSLPLSARSGCPKRSVLACFWAVFVCCGGRDERSSGRGIRVAGKVCCPSLRSPSVARPSLGRPKTASFGLFLGRFSRAAATAASGAKRQPSQHPGTPRVAQGWMGLSYSREGAARRFVRSPSLAARSGGPKRPVLACFWAVFVCCGGAR